MRIAVVLPEQWPCTLPNAPDCAISFSWCGKARSMPPVCKSTWLPNTLLAMAEHSMCHPGRPYPQGACHPSVLCGAAFQRAKSRARRFSPASPARHTWHGDERGDHALCKAAGPVEGQIHEHITAVLFLGHTNHPADRQRPPARPGAQAGGVRTAEMRQCQSRRCRSVWRTHGGGQLCPT